MTEAQFQAPALSIAATMTDANAAAIDAAPVVKVRKAPKTKGTFSFTGAAWVKSILSSSGICLKPSNHPKLVAHAIALKVGAPSDIKRIKSTLVLTSKVARKLTAVTE